MSKRKRNTNLQELDAQIDRVQGRIIRYANTLQKLRQARKRALANPPAKPFAPASGLKSLNTYLVDLNDAPAIKPEPEPVNASLDIPAALRRSPADTAAAARIEAEQTELKKKKAQARIAKMKAKQSGETRKMPLQGKAALDHIRNSE